jgi:hypothetical protein
MQVVVLAIAQCRAEPLAVRNGRRAIADAQSTPDVGWCTTRLMRRAARTVEAGNVQMNIDVIVVVVLVAAA